MLRGSSGTARAVSHPMKTKLVQFLGAVLCLATFFTTLFGSTPHAQADLTGSFLTLRHQPAKSFRLAPEFRYYASRINYDRNSDRIDPALLDRITVMTGSLPVAYGISNAVTLFGEARYIHVDLETTLGTATRFGFSDQNVGMNLRLIRSTTGMEAFFQVETDVPAYSPADDQNFDVVLGDGTTHVTGSGFFRAPLIASETRTLDLNMGAGFMWRSNDYDPAVRWSTELRYDAYPTGIVFAGRIGGLHSLTDETLSGAGNPCKVDPRAGGSCLFLAQHPSLVSAEGRLGYRFQPRLSVLGFTSTSLWGKEAPNGFSVGVALEFATFGSSDDPKETEPTADPASREREYGQGNKGFVAYTFEARVVRTNDQYHLLKIDKGTTDGVAVGDVLDVFSVTKTGDVKEAVARGRVTSVRSSEAAIKIVEYFREVWIEEGFVVKKPLQ